MSRTPQLPPRIPLQRKNVTRPSHELSSFSPPKTRGSGPRHHRSLSHNTTLDDQPAWLDDLLSDPDSIPKGVFHCRSASDSVALFRGIDEEHSGFEEFGDALESGYIYGPNSPRRKLNMEFSDRSVLSAFSSYFDQNPEKSVGEVSQDSRTISLDQKFSSSECNGDSKTVRRHPGQRSRARKLQYIGELERSVNVFQALESELTTKISSLHQQKVVLAMENSKLKQRMSRLQQQKQMMDGEYQTLKKEADRLKRGLSSCLSGRNRPYAGSSDANPTQPSWEMLDWERLRL